MYIKQILFNDPLWNKTIEYAKNCSWKAGLTLAKNMEENKYVDWERVFVVIENDDIAGYCAFTKKDCIPNIDYTPYIGYIFVGEQFRGNRLSEKMILFVMEYAKKLNFNEVYIISDHVNLYEKYGFIKIDQKEASWGAIETIFKRTIE